MTERLDYLREFSWKNATKLGGLCAVASVPVTELTILTTNLLTGGSFSQAYIADIRSRIYPLLLGVGIVWGGLSGGYTESQLARQTSSPSSVESPEIGSRRFSLERASRGAVRGFLTGIGVSGVLLSVMSALGHVPVDTILSMDRVPNVLAWATFFTTTMEATAANYGRSWFAGRI